MEEYPTRVICLSGKRKSGKDFIADVLANSIGKSKCVVIHLSGPIKQHWADQKELDMKELLSDGVYKEAYRLEMIKWSENQRAKDPGYFCDAAINMYEALKFPIWIVADARRLTDLVYFRSKYSSRLATVRITAADDVRCNRGFSFTSGIDDAESECGLDEISDWDFVIENNGGMNIMYDILQSIVNICQ